MASLNHELNTPLNIAIENSRIILENHNLSQSTKENIAMPLFQSILIMKNVVRDIYDYSQYLIGDLAIGFSEFKITTMIVHCVELFRIQAQMKNLELKCDIAPLSKDKIYSDPQRIFKSK